MTPTPSQPQLLPAATSPAVDASPAGAFYSGISRFRSPRVVGQSCAGAKPSGASVTSLLELPGASVPGLFTGHNSARGRIGDVDEHAATTNQHDADAPIGPFVLAAPQTPGAAGATGSTPGDTHCAVGRSSPA